MFLFHLFFFFSPKQIQVTDTNLHQHAQTGGWNFFFYNFFISIQGWWKVPPSIPFATLLETCAKGLEKLTAYFESHLWESPKLLLIGLSAVYLSFFGWISDSWVKQHEPKPAWDMKQDHYRYTVWEGSNIKYLGNEQVIFTNAFYFYLSLST